MNRKILRNLSIWTGLAAGIQLVLSLLVRALEGPVSALISLGGTLFLLWCIWCVVYCACCILCLLRWNTYRRTLAVLSAASLLSTFLNLFGLNFFLSGATALRSAQAQGMYGFWPVFFILADLLLVCCLLAASGGLRARPSRKTRTSSGRSA